MTLDPSARLRRSPDIVASDVDGELVLINIDDGKYYGLNPVGSAIWRQLEAPQSMTALVAALTEEFDGDPAIVERETIAFVGELTGQSLVLTE